MDPIRPKISMDYIWRGTLFGLVFLGFGLWSVYDGMVAYPAFNQAHDLPVFDELKAECRAEVDKAIAESSVVVNRSNEEERLWREKYVERFLEHLRGTDWWAGFVAKYRKDEGEDKTEIEALGHLQHEYKQIAPQYIMAALCLPVGLYGLLALFRDLSKRAAYCADTEGLHGFLPDTVPYDAIRDIDYRKWDRKGIAKLNVEQNGTPRTLTLDDWKFKGMEDILHRVEERRPELKRAEPAPEPFEAPEAPAKDPKADA